MHLTCFDCFNWLNQLMLGYLLDLTPSLNGHFNKNLVLLLLILYCIFLKGKVKYIFIIYIFKIKATYMILYNAGHGWCFASHSGKEGNGKELQFTLDYMP